MQKRTREILALVLLGALLLVGLGAMAYYMLVGHNWNVTASIIDDSIGKMDGYSVVLYEGTQPRVPDSSKDEEKSEEPEAAGFIDPEGDPLVDLGATTFAYLDKGAVVFTLDVSDLSQYSEPFVVAKNGMRMGFLAAGYAERRSDIRKDIDYLAEQGVDHIVAITDDYTLGGLAGDGTIKGISLIVCNDEKGRSPNNRYCGSTFCVNAPLVGEVGAVLISPSGVFSSKTVS